jgi:hypothetical protein
VALRGGHREHDDDEARSSGITTTNTYDALGQVTSITHQTPRLPDLPEATSTVAKWDGSLAIPGDLTECPAGTGHRYCWV